MELKYVHSKTYEYELDVEKLNFLTSKTNRSKGQTQFLYQLVDGDYEKLKQLEMKLKNCFCFYCPADKEEVEKVLNMVEDKTWFKL